MKQLYHYPQTNEELIRHYKLEPHPESGYYAVTWVPIQMIRSPFANNEERSIGTCIYYLLCHKTAGCPDKPAIALTTSADGSEISADGSEISADGSEIDPFKSWSSDVGVLHLNKSSTMHLHHAGRTKYTLISAKAPLGEGLVDENGDPLTKTVVMGDDIANGEVRQLLVEGGWWKVSEIPEADRAAARDGTIDPTRVGALISEVVTPGFHWDEHTYLNHAKLRELVADSPRAEELFAKYKPYVKEL